MSSIEFNICSNLMFSFPYEFKTLVAKNDFCHLHPPQQAFKLILLNDYHSIDLYVIPQVNVWSLFGNHSRKVKQEAKKELTKKVKTENINNYSIFKISLILVYSSPKLAFLHPNTHFS